MIQITANATTDITSSNLKLAFNLVVIISLNESAVNAEDDTV